MGAALFSQRGRGWCAFSLVELLVVVSIITVLMSIMLPALKRSLRQAASTVCMHNLRAIDQMMQMYRMESRGWLPHVTPLDDAEETEADQTQPWFDLLVPRYLVDFSVLICPDDPHRTLLERAGDMNPHPDWGNASSYGMSDFILASRFSYLAYLDRHPPRRPVDTILLADMGPDGALPGGQLADLFSGLDRNYGRLPWDDGFEYGNIEAPHSWLTRRHGKSINVLTLGGEVRSVRTAELMTQSIQTYYEPCAAGDCALCLDLEVAHYSFAHAQSYWWTGPVPIP
ncbi:MAG: type II secretion system protein [Planctomycetota bacterium]